MHRHWSLFSGPIHARCAGPYKNYANNLWDQKVKYAHWHPKASEAVEQHSALVVSMAHILSMHHRYIPSVHRNAEQQYSSSMHGFMLCSAHCQAGAQ